MMENDEDLLKHFFAEYKKEIPDNGFSRRVMHNLPNSRMLVNDVWFLFCTCLGIILFVFGDAITQLHTALNNMISDVGRFFASIQFTITSPFTIYFFILSLLIITIYMPLDWGEKIE